MKNPFQKGDRVSMGQYTGVVRRVSANDGQVRVQWHRLYTSTEHAAQGLNFADPQPLQRLVELEEYIAAHKERDVA